MIRDVHVFPHERFFADLRTQVIPEMLNPEKYKGMPVPSLPGFTVIVKGFCWGEMTVSKGLCVIASYSSSRSAIYFLRISAKALGALNRSLGAAIFLDISVHCYLLITNHL